MPTFIGFSRPNRSCEKWGGVMADIHIEEAHIGKVYDSRLIKRLLKYLGPYKKLFGLSLFFVLFVTAFEITLPFLVKTAIDSYIVPQYVVVEAQNLGQAERASAKRRATLVLPDESFLIDINQLEQDFQTKWELEGQISRERYFLVTPESPLSSREIAALHPDLFEELNNYFIIDSEKIAELHFADRVTIRSVDLEGVRYLALLFVGLLLLQFLFSFARTYIMHYTGQKIMYDMRSEIFAHLLKLPARFFDRNPVGRLVTRATNDVAAINEMYTAVLVNLFRDVFLIIGVLAVMFALNWKLTLVILALVPVLIFLTILFRRFVRETYREARKRLAMLNAYIQEHISGIKVVQLFSQESRSLEEFKSINESKYKAEMRQTIIYGIFGPMIMMMSTIAVGVIIWYGGGQVVQGTLTLGALVAFLSYARMLFQPVNDLSEKYNILQAAMASSERIFMLLDEAPEKGVPDNMSPKVRQAQVEFRDVWFAYKDDEWILKGVSFVVEAGQSLAIVGPTGAGKSTIISLVLRLYDVQKGDILIDGVSIKKYSLKHLRELTAVVLQDVFIFSGDIISNIRLHSENISEKEAVEAAEFVQADTFIERLPKKYHEILNERGSTLSAGQRQLLAFARAVAFQPKLLILDEATANIDSQTEKVIQDSLHKMLQKNTSIVIAHRLSTIRDANSILVLKNGKVAEQGSHEELLNTGELYRKLYEVQFNEGPASH